MVVAAAPATDNDPHCGAPRPSLESRDPLRPLLDWGSSINRNDRSDDPVALTDTPGMPTVPEDPSMPANANSPRENLLLTSTATESLDSVEEAQERASVEQLTATAEAAAARGAPRLLECLFTPNPARNILEADANDLKLLQQQDVLNVLLRHAIRAEHEDRETLQVLELLLLQRMHREQQVTTEASSAVREQLVDQLLLPHQQRHQQLPVECLCGISVEGGVFTCNSGSGKTEGPEVSAACETACRLVTSASSMHAFAHALFSCCCQGKLRCFLLLERCCSVAAANKLLLQQGQGSLMHAAAMGGSRAIIQRLVSAHALSPRGAPGKPLTTHRKRII